MVTCTILDDILNIHKADFHYTTILYPGVENYETLQNVMEPMISELHNLVINGLIDPNGTKWKIEPYFSSDWKFMAIILGFNAANANYFCPWCMCTKKDIGNRDKIHKIEKNMNQIQSLKPPPGHLKAPLLPMIPLDHYVPDELHVMLRIWVVGLVVGGASAHLPLAYGRRSTYIATSWHRTPLYRGHSGHGGHTIFQLLFFSPFFLIYKTTMTTMTTMTRVLKSE
jgi:hypothetical protein